MSDGHEPKHPLALRSRGGAKGMKAGDRVRSTIDGRTGIADEFTHDGETYMSWDDGAPGMYKWNHLEKIDPRTCDHDWRVPDGWQSGKCRKCGTSSTQR